MKINVDNMNITNTSCFNIHLNKRNLKQSLLRGDTPPQHAFENTAGIVEILVDGMLTSKIYSTDSRLMKIDSCPMAVRFKLKHVLTALLFFIIPLLGISQKDSSGIYFSSDDYLQQKLKFPINCKTQKHKIKSDLFFHTDEISIRHNGTLYRFPKDTVYAIRYCDGSIIRFYYNSKYPLMNPYESIMIYKVVSGMNTKNTQKTTKYYFSKDAKSIIQELTIYNIKSAFPDNHKFHDLIDMEFHSHEALTAYDNFHKIMKINRVLQNSLL